MNQQESPNMDKAQKRVTFFSTSLNCIFQIQAEKKGFAGEVPFILPARLVKFEGGNYSTDDEETIELIRNCKPYRKGRITEEAKKEVLAAQKTIRGAITTTGLRKEAGLEEKPQATAIQEGGITRCDVPGCNYVAEKDFAGRKIRMHKIGKHRKSMRPKPKDEGGDISFKKTPSLTEAKKGLKEIEIKK